ncbi:MAG: Gfo/Idh/MocA family oxidoreductase [Candidatus Lokiarchaeota archaeon]|nr:Gfo/Idh/MocA family oxidoreductase [Candidatus Lokiarchaeota archaeon]
MTLKIGLMGAGAFGTIHLEGFSKNPNCQLVAIASRTEEHAKAASEKFNVPKVYVGIDSWEKMLDNEELDVVSICTPNYLHAPIILKALERNCHIICEKPIAISREELHQIESKLTSKDLIFFTSFQKRYNPFFRLLKAVIEDGILGKITLARYYFSHFGPYKSWNAISEEKWFFDSNKAGGGVLLDLGVHCIDILRFLLGDYDYVDGINANSSCINMEDEDNCNVLFRFKNDALGLISVSYCNEPSETIDLFGTKGFIKVDLNGGNPISFGPKNLKSNTSVEELLAFKPIYESAQNKLIDHFIHCVLTKKQANPSFTDGKKAVEFVLEAYALKKKR